MGLTCQQYVRTPRTIELRVYYNYPFKSIAVTLHTARFNIQKLYLVIPPPLINAHNILQKPVVSSQIMYL
jgi:hypothetical protein